MLPAAQTHTQTAVVLHINSLLDRLVEVFVPAVLSAVSPAAHVHTQTAVVANLPARPRRVFGLLLCLPVD